MRHFILFLLGFSLTSFANASLPAEFVSAASAQGLALEGPLLVVDVASQTLTLYQGEKEVDRFVISTAKNGVGSRLGSYQTPPGLHRIRDRIGGSAAPYAIFRARKLTGEVWKPGFRARDGYDDLVLTRVLWLEGMEAGKNRGEDASGKLVDSYRRYIYIHGTNHENRLGSPASRGCVRMSTADIVELFPQVPAGTLVWIG